MRRIVLVFAAVLLASVGWSQTMTTNLIDGKTVKIDMNKVQSVEFSDDGDNGYNTNDDNPSNKLVGVWKLVEENNHKLNDAHYYHIKETGVFKVIYFSNSLLRSDSSRWEYKDNKFVYGGGNYPVTMSIEKLTETTLILVFFNGSTYVTDRLTKVSFTDMLEDIF